MQNQCARHKEVVKGGLGQQRVEIRDITENRTFKEDVKLQKSTCMLL
jgi:hypothetical protein